MPKLDLIKDGIGETKTKQAVEFEKLNTRIEGIDDKASALKKQLDQLTAQTNARSQEDDLQTSTIAHLVDSNTAFASSLRNLTDSNGTLVNSNFLSNLGATLGLLAAGHGDEELLKEDLSTEHTLTFPCVLQQVICNNNVRVSCMSTVGVE